MAKKILDLAMIAALAQCSACQEVSPPIILTFQRDALIGHDDIGAVNDVGIDAHFLDSSLEDASRVDAGLQDAGLQDAASSDAGFADAQVSDGGIVIIRARKSLVIALDGVRPDAFAHANTPHFDSLINGTWQAGYHGAYSETAQNLYGVDTVSGPNHAAIMTGATAAQHGVTSNSNVQGGDFNTYRHYLRLIEEDNAGRNTAYLFTWRTDRYITSGADYIFDGGDADNSDRVVAMLDGTHADSSGLGKTEWLAGTDPDAIFLFLDGPDGAGHRYGFNLTENRYITALETCDAQLGQMLQAISNRPTFANEDWQIMMTSDHGGYGQQHGADSATDHTIPFLIAGRHVAQGRLPPSTENVDLVPTVLAHMGVTRPSYLTGQVRGPLVQAAAPTMIGQSLLRYFRFDGNFADSSTVAAPHAATIGAESDTDPIAHIGGGKFGGYLEINDPGGGNDDSSYLTINGGTELDFGDNDNFTVTLWFKSSGRQGGDPLILGNKDWNSGQNAGWLISANEGNGNSFGSNFASANSDRIDLEDINYSDTEWWFIASVFDAQGNAILYAGRAIGGLRWIALKAGGVGDLTSSLPLNLGQDGTGEYDDNLDGNIDDLAIWGRALNHEEILRLYAGGAGLELHSQL